MTEEPKTGSSPQLHVVLLLVAIVIGAFTAALLLRPSWVPTVKIALAVPLSGEDSISGHELLQGARLAEELLGRSSQTTAEYRIQLEVFDDGSDTTQARAAALKIVADPRVVAVVGHFSSANTLAALPIYRTASLPVIMPVATLTEITKGGRFPNAYRMPPTNEEQAQTVVAFAREFLEATRIFTLHDGTEYGRNLKASITSSLRARRITEAGTEQISRGDEHFPVLTQLTAFDPPVDAVIFIGYSPEAVYLARQMSSIPSLNAALIGTDGVFGRRFRESDGSDGSYVVYQVAPDSVLEKRPQWIRYDSAFSARNLSGNPEGWTAWGYDAVGLALAAVQSSLEITRIPRGEVVREVIESSAQGAFPFRFEGALSDYEFDGTNDNKHALYWVYQVRGEDYVSVPWVYGNSAATEGAQ